MVTEPWNVSHREVLESSSLETVKKELAIDLSNLLYLTLFEEGIGLDRFPKCLLTSTVL